MDIGKLKNVALILLVLVNLCFAGILAADRLQSRGIEARENSELAAVLQDNGIVIDPDIIPKPVTVERWTLTRNQTSEGTLARALLGETQGVDQGGGIWLYESSAGWIRFRSGGEFEAELSGFSGGPGDVSNIISAVDASLVQIVAQYKTEDDSACAVYVYAFDGTEVVNCTVTVSADIDTVRISGMRMYGEPQTQGEQAAILPHTAIMGFLNMIKSSGGICNRIEYMEIGYMMSASAAGAALEPVWCIYTDADTYYIGAIDGRTLNGERASHRLRIDRFTIA